MPIQESLVCEALSHQPNVYVLHHSCHDSTFMITLSDACKGVGVFPSAAVVFFSSYGADGSLLISGGSIEIPFINPLTSPAQPLGSPWPSSVYYVWFQVATKRLYLSRCRSVGPSVRQSEISLHFRAFQPARSD